MKKILGILSLLVVICLFTAWEDPRFLLAYNIQNVLRWSSLYAIAGIGVAFVIITGGIDLSIGSVVGLVGCLLPMLLVQYEWGIPAALFATLVVSLAIGLAHCLLITRLRLQPFIVTLCGLLIYRGLARYMTGDQTQSFGNGHESLRSLATGKPFSFPIPFLQWISRGNWSSSEWNFATGSYAQDATGQNIPVDWIEWIPIPAPFIIMVVLAVAAGIFLNYTIWGRYLLALGRNEQAARYSGIQTERLVMLAYIICACTAGLAGVLFALDGNTVQPSLQGNSFELYAIAAAVLGGCSLRGGEGSILGVVIGAAVMRVLYNAINILRVSSSLEYAIIGGVILAGVVTDEIVKRLAARRTAKREQG